VPGPSVPVTPAGLSAAHGKRALFSSPGQMQGPEDGVPVNPLANRGPIVVECSSCREVTRVGLLDFLLFQLPFGAWVPRGRFDRRMTCPACRCRVWASVTLRRR